MSYTNYDMMYTYNMNNMFRASFNPFVSMYNSSEYYGSIFGGLLGLEIGNMLMQGAGVLISTVVNNYQSNDDKLKDLEAEKKEVIKNAGEDEDTILRNDETEWEEYQTLSDAEAKEENANSVYTNAKSATAAAKSQLDAAKSAFTPEMEALLNTYTSATVPEEKKAEFENAQIAKVRLDRANKAYEEAKKAEEEAKTELEKAEAETEKATKALDAKIATIDKAKSKIEEINGKITEIKYDIADGTVLNRVSERRLDKKINSEDENKYSDIKEAHLRAALYAYNNPKNKEDKDKYKTAFIEMCDAFTKNGGKLSGSLKEAYDLIQS